MAKLGDLITTVNGRLTLTSGTPVTTSDVTAATTLYFTPYKGDNIALYDTEEWLFYEFTERSISLSGYAADTNFDVFIYDNSGTLTLETVAWTNDTTRATALTTQNGVYVKSGDTTRRYLGTIRTTSTTGQCEDSETKRYCWNYYNRVMRRLYLSETTSHGYTTAAWRAWNNDTTTRFHIVVGVAEDTFNIGFNSEFIGNDTNVGIFTGVGYDTTGGSIADILFSNRNAYYVRTGSSTNIQITEGYHYLQAVEYGNALNPTYNVARMNGGLVG